MYAEAGIAACSQNKIAAVFLTDFCSLSLSLTGHAPYTHPYLGRRRSSGCSWAHLNEAQRGVYCF